MPEILASKIAGQFAWLHHMSRVQDIQAFPAALQEGSKQRMGRPTPTQEIPNIASCLSQWWQAKAIHLYLTWRLGGVHAMCTKPQFLLSAALGLIELVWFLSCKRCKIYKTSYLKWDLIWFLILLTNRAQWTIWQHKWFQDSNDDGWET